MAEEHPLFLTLVWVGKIKIFRPYLSISAFIFPIVANVFGHREKSTLYLEVKEKWMGLQQKLPKISFLNEATLSWAHSVFLVIVSK
jgi:hypothetical protein